MTARLPLRLADVTATLAAFGEARPLPASVYLDPRIFEVERAAIFGKAWLCAGRASDTPAPGSWTRPPLPWDVLVARGADLDLRAFHNVCRHRGAEIMGEASGRTASFTCPYHGWAYALDGKLSSAPFAPRGFDEGAHGLLPLAVAVMNDFVFCRLRDGEGARGGADLRGGAPPWLVTTELRHLRRAFEAEWETLANWKLVVENFQESHHFTRVHRRLEALTPSEDARSVLGDADSAWLGGTMVIGPNAETVSESGSRSGRPFIVDPALRRSVHDALLFPTWLTSLQPDYLLSYRLVPLGVDRTRVRFELFVHPEAPGGDALSDLTRFWTRVNAEDRAICESQQRAMLSPGFTPACFATVEDGVHAFQQKVARVYARALEGSP